MLNNNIFYHSLTRKVIVAFGSLFSNIRIERRKDGQAQQTIDVPIAYAPKEKWIVRIDQDPNLENHTYTTLPRLSFEITGMSYDATRKTSRMNYITATDCFSNTSKIYSPVPYNINITLYALTKTQEDALQIVEQILPYFTPEYTMSIKAIGSNVLIDVPIVLDNISVQDDYDGDFSQRRFVIYTINFTVKTYFYGPVIDSKLIGNTIVDITNPGQIPVDEASASTTTPSAVHRASGDIATRVITGENWTEHF